MTLIAFLLGILASWPALAILMIVGAFFEYINYHGTATLFAILGVVSATIYFHLTLVHFLIVGAIYVTIGFIWSIWRYKRALDYAVNVKDSISRRMSIKQLDPTEATGTIAVWVLIWPISLIENSLRDIFSIIESMIKGIFRNIYRKLYDNALNKASNTTDKNGE